MHKYEFATIIECEGKTDDEIQKTIGKIRELISEHKGKIVKEDVWGKRELAYPIQKQNNGFYMFTTLMLEPASVINLEKKMKLLAGNLRFMLINLDNEPGYQQQILEDAAKEESEKNNIPVEDQKEEKTEIKSKPVETDKKEEIEVDTSKEEVNAKPEKEVKEEKEEKEEKEVVEEKTPVKVKPAKKEKEEKKKDEKQADQSDDKKEDNKDLDKLLEEIL